METETPAATRVPLDEIIKRYIALRDKKADLKAAYTKSVEDIEAGLDRIEAFLLRTMSSMGVESLRSAEGTAYQQLQTSATVADWDATLAFIQETGQWSMLEKRVSKAFVEAYKTEHNDLPPGINWREERKVNIRRS